MQDETLKRVAFILARNSTPFCGSKEALGQAFFYKALKEAPTPSDEELDALISPACQVIEEFLSGQFRSREELLQIKRDLLA